MSNPALLLLPALSLYLALFVFSHFDVLVASLSSGTHLALDHYQHFFGEAFYRDVLLRTVLVSATVTGLSLLIGFPVAAYLVRPGGRARAFIVFAVIAPMLMSAVARSYGWIILLGPNGVLDRIAAAFGVAGGLHLLYSTTGIVIALAHVFLPFMVLAIAGSLQQIDPAVLRAAEVLGASPARTFLRVVLPLSVPGLVSGALIVFCLSASSFVTPALVGGVTVPMMSYAIYNQALMLLDWPFACAIAIILLITTAAAAGLMTALASLGQRHAPTRA